MRSVLSEWVLAVTTLLISVVFLYLSQSFPVLQADPGGTALVPRIAASATALSALLLSVRLVRRAMQGRDAEPAASRASALATWDSPPIKAASAADVRPPFSRTRR